MRHYEIVFFVHPDQSTQVPSMVERYKKIVTESGGIVHRHEDWGRRRLAHPVVKIHKAHYVLLNIECVQQVIADLQHAFRFNDAVLRHLITTVPEAETDASPMMKKPAEQDEVTPESSKKEAPVTAVAEPTTAEPTTEGDKASQLTDSAEPAKPEEKPIPEESAPEEEPAASDQDNKEPQE